MTGPKPLRDLVHPSWAGPMEPVAAQVAAMGEFLREELAAGRRYLPAGENILRAFAQPLDEVKVLVVGQDPYPTPGHPIGLCFAVERHVRPLPKSLVNIYQELHDDTGIVPPEHGDLSAWTRQGVMLLNRVLTVQAGQPASHRGKGWEAVTEHAIRVLAGRGKPLVSILWGSDAQTLRPLLPAAGVIASPHPSPLSAHRGFFGSKPFSRANDILVAAGLAPVDWRLDP